MLAAAAGALLPRAMQAVAMLPTGMEPTAGFLWRTGRHSRPTYPLMSTRDIRLADGTEANKTRPPVESLLFAIAGVVPTLAGAVATWLIAPDPFIGLTIVWSAAILCFLAGVRRGLSFRQAGGPTLEEVATFIVTFSLGLAALLVPWAPIAVGLALIGYVLIGVSDLLAAKRAEAPPYFAGLRPVQVIAAVVALAALFLRVA